MLSLELEFDPKAIFDTVARAGAEADLMLDAASQISFKVHNGALESYKVSETRVLGLRVIHHQRVGVAYSESLEGHALDRMVEQALANAKVAKQDRYQQLMPLNRKQVDQDSDIYCEESVAGGELLDHLKTLEANVLDHESIQSCPYNGLSSTVSGRRIFSTSGLDVQTRSSSCSAFIYALAKNGDDQAMSGTGQVGRRFSQLDLNRLAAQVQQNVLDLLPGKPVETAHFDVIFSRDCLSNVFDVFASVLSAKTALEGINPWSERVGQQVASSSLSLVDRPHMPGFGRCLFDDEGLETRDTVIIKDGQLQTLLHNFATAQAFNLAATGHGVRGPKSDLGVGHHQLSIAAGDMSSSQLERGCYLEIVDVTGLHSGANSVTGDFSFGAAGYLCRDGARQRSVRGITIAGNFYDCLNKLTIGGVADWNWQKTYHLPLIRFHDLAVSGD